MDMKDIGYVALRFGAVLSSHLWDQSIDFNEDGKIDMKDIGGVCKNFGKTT